MNPLANVHVQAMPISNELPLVSVIVAVRNEENSIRRVMEQIIGQDYPCDRLEIIVVDGQSDDRTADIAASFSEKGRVLHVIRLPERGRAQGLNRGIQAASGEVILRIDARTSVDHDYISRCVETLQKTGADNVGGVQSSISKSRRQESFAMAQSHPFGVGDAQFRLGQKSGPVDSVYLGCFRREVFDKVGLFDERAAVISEDSDINYRIRMAGGAVYMNKDIKAYYYPRETFVDQWRLYYRYGGARVGNFLKHRALTSWRQAIPPLLLLSLVVSGSLALLDFLFSYVLLAIAVVYCGVNALVSARITINRRRVILTPLLICTFFCMHFGYAFGFWKRLLIPPKAGTYWGG